MIAFLIFFGLIFGGLAANHSLHARQLNKLAVRLGAQRLLTRGSRALQTRDYVLEIVDNGWRVEVPGIELGRRMALTLTPGLSPLGFKTGFAEVDRAFRITGDDATLAATIFSDPSVRATLHQVDQLTNLLRIDLTNAETLVVLFRRRRRVSEVEALDSVVAFAAALNSVAQIRAQLSAGAPIGGSVGGASGSPFAMPVNR